MKNRWTPIVLIMGLLAAAWAVQPITGAIAAVMKAKIVNTVKVKESGALVKKIFDEQLPGESNFAAGTNLLGYKTVRVAIYQTTEDGSTSDVSPIEINSCEGVPDTLGINVEFGSGNEGGVQSGNNVLELDEPPSLTTRDHLYVGEFPVLRPQMEVSLCNNNSDPVNVEVFIYAFRN